MFSKLLKKKPEDFAWVLVGLGGFLWALGGWTWKPFRRMVWPISTALTAYWYKLPIIKVLIFTVASIGLLTLGYSPEKSGIVKQLLLGFGYGALGWLLSTKLSNWWYPLVTLVVFVSFFQLSLHFNWFTWKFVETATGIAQGFVFAHAIMKESKVNNV